MRIGSFGVRRLHLLAALAMGFALVFGLSGTTAAYQIIKQTGHVGQIGVHDTKHRPGGTCTYVGSDTQLQLTKLVALREKVWPADSQSAGVTPAGVFHYIMWTVVAQRSRNGGAWQSIASVTKHGKAYANKPAVFGPLSVSVHGKAHYLYRLMVTIQWHGNGSVVGQITFCLDHYGARGDVTGKFVDGCPGMAA